MIPNTFSYVKPASLDELFPLMREEGSCLYAGGTDVLVYLRDGNLSPGSPASQEAFGSLPDSVRPSRTPLGQRL